MYLYSRSLRVAAYLAGRSSKMPLELSNEEARGVDILDFGNAFIPNEPSNGSLGEEVIPRHYFCAFGTHSSGCCSSNFYPAS